MTTSQAPVVGETVRVLFFPKGHYNEYARVVSVNKTGIRVSNMNMPFQGTFANYPLTFKQFERLIK